MFLFLDQWQKKERERRRKSSRHRGLKEEESDTMSSSIERRGSVSEHMDENQFIPVGLEIPQAQIRKLKEGHDLVIRLKNTEILGISQIRDTDKLNESFIAGKDESTAVIRVKKTSTTENPAGTSTVEIFHPRKISREQQAAVGIPAAKDNLVARVKKLSNGLRRPDTAQLIIPEKHLKDAEILGVRNPAFREEEEDELVGEGSESNEDNNNGAGEASTTGKYKRRRSGVVNADRKLFEKVKKISTGVEPNISELLHHRRLDHDVVPAVNSHPFPNRAERDDKEGDFEEQVVRKRSHQVHFVDEVGKRGDFNDGQLPTPMGVIADDDKRQVIFDPSQHETKKIPQVLAAFGASLGAFAFGTVLAWSSTATADLQRSEEFGEPLTNGQISWISSIATLGAVGACPIAGYGMGKYGRRKVMMYLTGPFILGWILIALARDVWQILLGRFITGLCGGCFSIAVPIFTSETAEADIRGGLGTFFDILMSAGMLYIYVIGQYTTWRIQAALCAIIPIAFHVIMFWIPESPRYLIEKEKVNKAEKAMYWLKGVQTAPALVKWEMSEISKSVCELRETKFTIRDTFRRPIVKPTILMFGIMMFTTLSGFDVVVAYTVIIFQSAGSGMDPGLSTIIIGVVSLFASFPSALFVDKAGRKILLVISGVAMTFSLSALGFFFYVKNEAPSFATAEDLSWLPLTALIAFIISFSTGFGPLHIMLIGEILPNHLKGLTSCLVLMVRWAMAFLLTNVFQSLNAGLGEHGTFWLFAVVCLLSVPYVVFLLPETKGKTIDEIQIYFVKA